MTDIEDHNFTRFDLQELMEDGWAPCEACGAPRGGDDPHHCCLCLGSHEEFAACERSFPKLSEVLPSAQVLEDVEASGGRAFKVIEDVPITPYPTSWPGVGLSVLVAQHDHFTAVALFHNTLLEETLQVGAHSYYVEHGVWLYPPEWVGHWCLTFNPQ